MGRPPTITLFLCILCDDRNTDHTRDICFLLYRMYNTAILSKFLKVFEITYKSVAAHRYRCSENDDLVARTSMTVVLGWQIFADYR